MAVIHNIQYTHIHNTIIVHDDPDADSSMSLESLDYHMVARTFWIRKFSMFLVLILHNK